MECYLWWCVVFLSVRFAFSFNLDISIPVVKEGAQSSYFGYSVAEHQTVDAVSSEIEHNWLLVGAPLGNNLQPNTSKSGALFKCPLTNDRKDCEQVVTDGKRDFESDKLTEPGNDEIKDGQWLGVTVRSHGSGGKVMVCAHRYMKKGPDFRWGQGLCYTLTQHLDFDEAWEPCKGRPTNRAHEQFGYCQAGTSGFLLDDTAVIGTPGPYTWRGTVFVLSVLDNYFDRDKTVYYGPLVENKSPVDKYSYLGMSVTAGEFFRHRTGYAAGAPRSNGTGQVVIFTKKREGESIMLPELIINGEQFASSFGYELATADLNNDGVPDLLVGAPFYHDKESGGAVYIYLNSYENGLLAKSRIKLVGKPESRFGFAITNAGDLNLDGYEDIAIGAPYDEGGKVFIYLGSANGIITEPSQVLKAEDLPDTPRTFGYSLNGGLDLDLNKYPDLLVGAYEVDRVYLLRARPIIGIFTTVQPERNLRNIDPSVPHCRKYPNSNMTCFTFQACFNITAAAKNLARNRAENLKIQYRIEAETFTTKKFSRVWFAPDEKRKPHIKEHVISLSELHYYCSEETVYIKNNTKDIQSPIKFKLTYTLLQKEPTPGIPGRPLPSIDDYPILNQQEAAKIFEATFQKDCGENDICESNLFLAAGFKLPKEPNKPWELSLGEVQEVVLEVTVSNYNESAYEAQLYIITPESLNFINAADSEEKPFHCQIDEHNSTLLVCRLGNPFKTGSKSLKIRFSPSEVEDLESLLEFILFANSTSEEIEHQDPLSLQITVVKRADLSLKGSARPEQVFYGGVVKGESAMKYRDEIGSRVLHTYQVFNKGPWKVGRLEVHIEWPFQVANDKPLGKWLLYLEERPTVETLNRGECILDSSLVDPLSLPPRPGVTEIPLKASSHHDVEESGGELRRRKRDTEQIVKAEYLTDKDGRRRKVVSMNCRDGTAMCFKFHCVIHNLLKNQGATIRIPARLWNSTLVEDYPRVDWVKIGSIGRIVIPEEFEIKQSELDDKIMIETTAYPDLLDQQEPEPVPIWIIIVAVVAGLLLLILLTLVLWKLGFFKRRRPDPTLSGNLEKHKDTNGDFS